MISTTTEQNYLLSDSIIKVKLLFFIANFYLWHILFVLLMVATLSNNYISTLLVNASVSNSLWEISSSPWAFDSIVCGLIAIVFPFFIFQNMIFDERTHKELLFKHKNTCQMLLIAILMLANCTALFLIQNPNKILQFMSTHQFFSCIMIFKIGLYNLRPGHIFYLENPEESLVQEISFNMPMLSLSTQPNPSTEKNYDERENQNARFWQAYAYSYSKFVPFLIGGLLLLTAELCRNTFIGPMGVDLMEKFHEIPVGYMYVGVVYFTSYLLTDLPDFLAAWNGHKIPHTSS